MTIEEAIEQIKWMGEKDTPMNQRQVEALERIAVALEKITAHYDSGRWVMNEELGKEK